MDAATNAALSKQAGRGHEPWKHTMVWAERRAETEKRFRELMGPDWQETVRGLLGNYKEDPFPTMGNCQKVACMELMMNQHTGVIQLERFPSEGLTPVWHRIKRFVVPKDKREAFDTGFVSSVVSRRNDPTRGSWKTPLAAWRRMGFTEKVQEDGSLLYQYSPETFQQMQGICARAEKKRKQPHPPPPQAAPMLTEQEAEAQQRLVVAEARAQAACLRAIAAEQTAVAAEYRARAAEHRAVAAEHFAHVIEHHPRTISVDCLLN